MKTLLLIITACMLSMHAYSQKKASPRKSRHVSSSAVLPKVPDNLQVKFGIAYPEATVTGWQTEGEYYKVLFMDKNMHQVIVYDTTGKVMRKETELDAVNVPPAISEYYKSAYPDKKDYKVWHKEDASGRKSYSSLVRDEVLYFDEEGKYIRGEKRPVLKIRQAPAKKNKK